MDILLSEYLDKPLWMWIGFFGVIFVLLALDLGIFHRKDHEIGVKESLLYSLFYIVIGLIFGLFVWHTLGQESALEYYTGFVIEKSLSMDNLFVMALIFSALSIPRKYQHRVLFWGILGVIIMRGAMIILGAAIVHNFEWVLYLFAAFLIFTGIKLLLIKDDGSNHEEDIQNNPVLKFFRTHFRLTDKLHGHAFFVRQKKTGSADVALHITPLFLALMTIEIADVIFAVDSVPAIFAITTDTYVVMTSNVFAILGLRALYFALSAMMARFKYLKYSVALILVFIGAKVFVPLITPLEKVPASISLSVTIGLLVIGMLYSLRKTREPSH